MIRATVTDLTTNTDQVFNAANSTDLAMQVSTRIPIIPASARPRFDRAVDARNGDNALTMWKDYALGQYRLTGTYLRTLD